LALWLTRLGVRVRIVDKTAEPGTTSRALAVQARTLELDSQIGLGMVRPRRWRDKSGVWSVKASVPTNFRALVAFRDEIAKRWRRLLIRRGDMAKLPRARMNRLPC
jgi:2-polyprenyl-6-methoxyphenol hydroxylase-like FAD-dependent oxidoreductase